MPQGPVTGKWGVPPWPLTPQHPVTILVLDLGGPGEDPVGHLHSPRGPKVGPVHFALLAEAGQDLAGFHGVPPDIVAMSVGGTHRLGGAWGGGWAIPRRQLI